MAKRMSRYPSDRKVYVGDLGNNAKKNDLEYAFGAYGTLRSVWIARNPPGFAFVEFESARDAADAVRGLDGRTVCGRRARVELSTGKFAGGGDRRGGGGGGGGDRRGDGGGGRGGPGGGGGGMRDRPRRNNADETKCYECGGRGHYARECRRRDGRRGSRRREVFTYQPEADNTLSVKKRKHSETFPEETKEEEPAAEDDAYNEPGTSEKKKKKKKKNKNKDQDQEQVEAAEPAKKKLKTKEPDSD